METIGDMTKQKGFGTFAAARHIGHTYQQQRKYAAGKMSIVNAKKIDNLFL